MIFFSPFKWKCSWHGTSLKQLLIQNLKPMKLPQYDAALIQAPSELKAKSSPEDWCPKEFTSAIQVMTFVDKVWSINNVPKNTNTAWHWPPCGLLLTECLALSVNTLLPGRSKFIQREWSEPRKPCSTPHKPGYSQWPTWTLIQWAHSSPKGVKQVLNCSKLNSKSQENISVALWVPEKLTCLSRRKQSGQIGQTGLETFLSLLLSPRKLITVVIVPA